MSGFYKKILCVLSCCFFISGAAWAAQGEKVIFYPTDVSDAGELAYLADSVRLMFASRLANIAGVQPVNEKEQPGSAKSCYRVQSVLVSTDKGTTVSALVYSPGSAASVQFQATSPEGEHIMQLLDELVAEIGEVVFDVKKEVIHQEKPMKKKVATDFYTPHPDRQIKENSGFGLSIDQDEFVAQMAVEVENSERYKGEVYSYQTRAMSAGDLDGDAMDEILLATNDKIYVYQLRNQRIYPLAAIPLPAKLKVHGLNVADLNHNGTMEIYLSCTKNNDPTSFILEWHPETGLKWLSEWIPLYIRPIRVPGQGVILAGQRGGLEGEPRDGIYTLVIKDDGQVATDTLLAVPDGVNLFAFVFADLEGDKVPEVVAITVKEELVVYNGNMDRLYTSPSGFGGREARDGLNPPIRMVATDFDMDGRDDILLVDNELFSPEMLSESRYYENGQVRGLLWDKDLFLEMWHTNVFTKSIVDFQFLPIPSKKGATTSDGRLFIVEPAKGNSLQGLLFNDGGSRLSVYGMHFVPKR